MVDYHVLLSILFHFELMKNFMLNDDKAMSSISMPLRKLYGKGIFLSSLFLNKLTVLLKYLHRHKSSILSLVTVFSGSNFIFNYVDFYSNH